MKSHPWACLVTLKTGDGHYSHIIGKQGFTVGRSSDADLPIIDPRVSRSHLTVEVDGEFIYIKDQESANGTFVNDNQLAPGERKIIRAEDIVRLGKYTGKLHFRAIPMPFELMDKSQPSLKTVLNEFSAELEKNIRIAIEKELEKDRAAARKQAEAIIADAEKQAEAEYEKAAQTHEERFKKQEAAAARITADAKALAQKLTEDAKVQSQKLTQDTQTQCQQAMTEARAHANQIIAEARTQGDQMRNDARAEIDAALEEALKSEKERVSKELEVRVEQKLSEMDARATSELERLKIEEIEKFESKRMALAQDLAGKITTEVLLKFDEWVENPDDVEAKMDEEILELIEGYLSGRENEEEPKKRQFAISWRGWRPRIRVKKNWVVGPIAGVILLGALFGEFQNGLVNETLPAPVPVKRRIQSVFSPKKTDKYQNSYMNNVLFMNGYVGAKTDPEVMKKWRKQILRLHLGVSDQIVSEFVAKESDLVRRLAQLRSNIDGANPGEGLDRMRKAEEDGLAEIKTALKGDLNFERVHAAEKKFLESLQ